MGGIDLLLIFVFVTMGVAVMLDRRLAAVEHHAEVAQPKPAETVMELATDILRLPQLTDYAQGWALMGPTGTVVATNLPERAGWLAGACAALRLSGPSGEPWHSVMLQGEGGFLLGEASPRGAVLAVLARSDTGLAALRSAMSDALVEVERRWDELVPVASTQSLPEPEECEAGSGVPSPFLPLE